MLSWQIKPWFRGIRTACVLLLFGLFCAWNGLALASESSQQWNEDLAIYRQVIQDLHPAFFRIQDEERARKFLSEIKSLSGRLNREAYTLEDFFSALMQVNAKLACGHSKMRPPAELIRRVSKQPELFPLPVYINGSDIYVKNRPTPSSPWNRLLSINGHSSDVLLRELGSYMAADLESSAAKIKRLEPVFALAMAVFLPGQSTFEIQFTEKPDSHKIQKHLIRAVNLIQLRQNLVAAEPSNRDHRSMGLEINHDLRLATLTIPSFLGLEEDFKQHYGRIFQIISQGRIEHLVIDLRGNEGGLMPNAIALLPFLLSDSESLQFSAQSRPMNALLAHWKRIISINGQKVNRKLRIQVEHFLKRNFQPRSSDLLGSVENFELNQVLKPDKSRFNGRLSLLVDGLTSSSASMLVHMLLQKQRATLIGTAIGGSFGGHNGNIIVQFSLPHSGIVFDLPMVALQYPKLSGGGSFAKRFQFQMEVSDRFSGWPPPNASELAEDQIVSDPQIQSRR